MSDKLVRQTAKLLGASAVAGFGFTFGRELYKKAKGSAVLFVILLVLLFGIYNSGLMIARNYQSKWEAILKRLVGVAIGIPSAAIIWFMVFSMLVPSSIEMDDVWSLHHTYYTIPAVPAAVLFAIGFIRGTAQRSTRRRIFIAEKENRKFLDRKRLVELDDGRLQDKETGQVFVVDAITSERVTLRPEGSRGKRAFITISPAGVYQSYSGVVRLREI